MTRLKTVPVTRFPRPILLSDALAPTPALQKRGCLWEGEGRWQWKQRWRGGWQRGRAPKASQAAHTALPQSQGRRVLRTAGIGTCACARRSLPHVVTSVWACSRLARANRTPLLPPRLPRPLHAWHFVQELSAGLVDGSLERRHGLAAAAVPATAPAAKEARGHDREWRRKGHTWPPHNPIRTLNLTRARVCAWV